MFSREWKRSVWAVGAVAVLASACGGEASGDESFDETGDELSTSGFVHVTVRRDYRKCSWPMCGGYYAKDVNKNTAEKYVHGLDFTGSGFDQATQDNVKGAADGELVLKAKLGRKLQGYHSLVVQEAYRGLPGVSPSRSDVYFKATLRSPQITCVTAPCNNIRAEKLATSSKPFITGLDVELAAMPFVQQDWLAAEVLAGNAIVAGQILDGQRFPGGKEKILVATQVFLKLPVQEASCPVFRLRACPEGQTWTYRRDERRCVLPVACQESMMCAAFVPSCENGYGLRTWTGANGCTAFACDPEFSYTQQ